MKKTIVEVMEERYGIKETDEKRPLNQLMTGMLDKIGNFEKSNNKVALEQDRS